MGKAIGIDLGTTNTVAAEARSTRVTPTPISMRDGGSVTRSVVAYDNDTWLVGESAEELGSINPESVIASSKRFIGINFDDGRIQADIAHLNGSPGRPCVIRPPEGEAGVRFRLYSSSDQPVDMSPVDVAMRILRQVREDASLAIGQVTHAVITVPAYFDGARIEATRQAGEAAGFVVQRVISEPLAAALAYGSRVETDKPETVLVFDLGGGTFDVTISTVGQGACVELAKKGNNHLGGDDFDTRLEQFVLQRLRTAAGIDLSTPSESGAGIDVALQKIRYDLRKECRRKKEALSSFPETTISQAVWSSHPRAGGASSVKVTRAEFEALIIDLIDEAMSLTDQALAVAHCTVDQIDKVLLVGGSTYIPAVRQRLQEKFGVEKVKIEIPPMEAVALGAAILALTLPRRIMCPKCHADQEADGTKCTHCGASLVEVLEGRHPAAPAPEGLRPQLISTTARTIGIETDEGALAGMIKSGSQYSPTEGKGYVTERRSFRIPANGIRALRVAFYEGEAHRAADLANSYYGETVISDLPMDIREGEEVRIEATLNGDGSLVGRVEIRGQQHPYILTPSTWRKQATEEAENARKVFNEVQDQAAKSQLQQAIDQVMKIAVDPSANGAKGKAAIRALEVATRDAAGTVQLDSLAPVLKELERALFMAATLSHYGDQWVARAPLVRYPEVRELLLNEAQLLTTLQTAISDGRRVSARDDVANAPRATERLDALISASQLLWPLTLAQLVSEMSENVRGTVNPILDEELVRRKKLRQTGNPISPNSGPDAVRQACANEIGNLLSQMAQSIVTNPAAFDSQFSEAMRLVDRFFGAGT